MWTLARDAPAPAPFWAMLAAEGARPMTTSSPQPTARRSRDHGSNAVTDGVRVTVRPQFLPMQSTPSAAQFLFAYHITIRNEGPVAVKLRSRHWVIVDANGERNEVQGDGVIGHTPHIQPGESFEYASYCPLPTPWGTMEGVYRMARDDGSEFDAAIARFYLVSEDAAAVP